MALPDEGTAPPPPVTDERQSQPPVQKSDEELADKLYDPHLMYGPALKSGFDRIRDLTGASETEVAAQAVATSRFFSDARIPVREAEALHSLFTHHLDKPADDETVQQWTVESRRQMRETYGPDADARLAAVKEFLDRHPGIQEALHKSGLGSHPRIVMRLAENTRQFRAKGK